MKRNQTPTIDFTNHFNTQRKKAPLEIKIAFRDALEVFIEDPDNKFLRNHSLDKIGKRFFGVRSINITDDWRALYRKGPERIIVVELGTHEELYS